MPFDALLVCLFIRLFGDLSINLRLTPHRSRPLIRDLAIDLGTANTLVYARGEDIIYNEPSVIAFETNSDKVLAVGDEAWHMIGRTASHIQAHRPLRNGAITDYNVTQQMILLVLKQIGVNRFNRPKALICIPSALSPVERQAVIEASHQAGVVETQLIDQPLAAAFGTHLVQDNSRGNMIVDIGGGTSESALISIGKVMHSTAVRIGSFDFDTEIQTYIRRKFNFAIGERTAEDIKIIGGTAMEMEQDFPIEVRGRDIDTGLPQTFILKASDIREAIEQPLNNIITSVYDCLTVIGNEFDNEFAEDLVENGIHLAGGGSLLRGLDKRIHNRTQIPVKHVEKPLECVVRGAGLYLESFSSRRIFSKGSKRSS